MSLSLRTVPALALCLAVAVSATGSSTAVVAESAEPATEADLATAFALNSLPASITVVIDTSASMSVEPGAPYPKVVEAYRGLVDAVPAGFQLNVVLFDTLATTVFAGPVTGSNRQDAAGKLPPEAQGAHTDIGRAVEAAIDLVDRADAPEAQMLIVITDGQHDAGGESPYLDLGSDAWNGLRTRGPQVETTRNLEVRALGIGGAGRQGAELVAGVFPGTQVLDIEVDQMQEYLTAQVDILRQNLLRGAVQREIDAGVVKATLTIDGRLRSEVSGSVTLSSNLPHLGVDVDLRNVTATLADGTPVRIDIVGGSRTVHVPPAGTATFDVLVKPMVSERPFYELPPVRREEVDITVQVAAAAAATPTSVLRDLGCTTDVAITQPDEFTLGRSVGATMSTLLRDLALLLLALLLLYWVWWKFVRLPRLIGVLEPAADESGYQATETVFLKGRRMTVSGKDFLADGGDSELLLYTKRRKHKQVYARVIAGSFESYDPARYEWKPFESGQRLGIPTYRLNQERGPYFRWHRTKSAAE